MLIDGVNVEYPDSLDKLVVALCADFKRRDDAVKNDNASKRSIMEYVYLNERIMDAASEICSSGFALHFINDIATSTGYVNSNVKYICESAYKKNKKLIKYNIARKLHLI